MCEVEFLGGVVLEERTFDNFSVGRYSTAHYQVVDLEDVQLQSTTNYTATRPKTASPAIHKHQVRKPRRPTYRT